MHKYIVEYYKAVIQNEKIFMQQFGKNPKNTVREEKQGA